MFGDWNWLQTRSANQSNNFDSYLARLKYEGIKPVIIEIGAGKAVPTVRYKSEAIANEFDCTLIRINPRDSDMPQRIKGFSIPLGALEGINNIFKLFRIEY